jgi:(1->4)-alpha-D-glucan 1-alpha-D-glucosylmutase
LQRAVAHAESAPSAAPEAELATARVGQARPFQKLTDRLSERWADGRVKLYLTWRALSFRRSHLELFRRGAYLPLRAAGPLEEHVCAFLREQVDEQIVVVVPRLTARLLEDVADPMEAGPLRFRAGAWDETTLLLPDRHGQRYRDLFTGTVVQTVEAKADTLQGARSALPLGTLLAGFPVAMLARESL